MFVQILLIALMVHNYRFLDFFRFCIVFVRVTLYYFGCMFVASSLNHFWFWFWSLPISMDRPRYPGDTIYFSWLRITLLKFNYFLGVRHSLMSKFRLQERKNKLGIRLSATLRNRASSC